MAPFIGPTREKTIALLCARNPPKRITLGYMEPHAQVVCIKNNWYLENLVRDEVAIDEAYQKSQREGFGFMPENTWIFKERGSILLSGVSAADLAEKIRGMDIWPYSPE